MLFVDDLKGSRVLHDEATRRLLEIRVRVVTGAVAAGAHRGWCPARIMRPVPRMNSSIPYSSNETWFRLVFFDCAKAMMWCQRPVRMKQKKSWSQSEILKPRTSPYHLIVFCRLAVLNTTWLMNFGRDSPASTSRKIRWSISAASSMARPSQSKKMHE